MNHFLDITGIAQTTVIQKKFMRLIEIVGLFGIVAFYRIDTELGNDLLYDFRLWLRLAGTQQSAMPQIDGMMLYCYHKRSPIRLQQFIS